MATQADEAANVAQDDASANDDTPELTEVEQIALDRGWKKDKPDNWVGEWRDAASYLRNMRVPRDYLDEISSLKSSIAGIARAADKQVKREVSERTKEIEARFAAAVEEKDTAGAAQAAKDMRALEAEQSAPAVTEDYEAKFTRENPWYGKHDEASAYAVVLANKANAAGKSPEDQLKFAAEGVRKVFPDLFDDAGTAPKPPLTLNAPGRGVAAPKTRTFADMPPAAKSAADRFYEQAKARNPDKVPERKAWDAQYAKDFFDNAA